MVVRMGLPGAHLQLMRVDKEDTLTARIKPFMPDAEVAHLKQAYAEAKVILEYGSGGSTEIAARLGGKYIMSVESDRSWAWALRKKLAGPEILSPAVVLHVDIGPTGPWGRPLNDRGWRNFHAYANDVWDQPWFRHPDVILIDGRFRTACLATALLRAEHPIRVLFDDYGVRPFYHQMEEVIEPDTMIGRMAEFRIEPGQVEPRAIGLLISQFFQPSIHGMSEEDYQKVPPRRLVPRRSPPSARTEAPTTRAASITAELRRRVAEHLPRTHLFVDYYRIRRRVAYPLPIRAMPRPELPIRGFKPAYPWPIWMIWALEERIGVLGDAAERSCDDMARRIASEELAALCEWPDYRQSEAEPHLVIAHVARILCTAVERWSWPEPTLREAMQMALSRIAGQVDVYSAKLYGNLATAEQLRGEPKAHTHVQNIPLIVTLAGARAARTAGHPSQSKLDVRADLLVRALLDLRERGVHEGVSYDGYVLDFVLDWVNILPEADQSAILDHPRMEDFFIQSSGLAVPGDATGVAALGDVEPIEMTFHISAQAKLQRLRPTLRRTWYLDSCNPARLRVAALVELNEAPIVSLPTLETAWPQGPAFLKAGNALVLRSGWEDEDLAVAIGASGSPMGHIQCDNGSIVIGTRGYWAIQDPGYQQYLGTSERNFTIGPEAHNAPIVNGEGQIAKRVEGYRLLRPAADVLALHLELGACYQEALGIQMLTRSLWLLGRKHVIVRDRLRMSGLNSLRYIWHGHETCAWGSEGGLASLHAPDIPAPLLFIQSPQVELSSAQIHRLRGSRGQMSLVADLDLSSSQPDEGTVTALWTFSTVAPATLACDAERGWISIGGYDVDIRAFDD